MDPLSITASLIAILTALNAACIGLRKVINLKDAPDAILALNNELQDLQRLLTEVHWLSIKEEGDARTQSLLRSYVLPCAQRARSTLQKLETVLEYGITKPEGVGFNKLTWLRATEKITLLQKDLRQCKQDIQSSLALLNTSSLIGLETKFEGLQLITKQGYENASSSLDKHTDTLVQALMIWSEAQKQNEARLSILECKKLELAFSDAPTPCAAPKGEDHDGRKHDLMEAKSSILLPGTANDANLSRQFSALRMQFSQRQKCNPYCTCACHRITRLNTSKSLQYLFGSLCIGYSSVPLIRPSCDDSECCGRGSGFVTVNYYFPRWLVARVIATAVHFAEGLGPELQLRTLRVRDTSSPIFAAVVGGDAHTVHRLITSGEASVIDVTADSSHSALHLAVMHEQVEVITILMRLEAEPLLENAAQETSYEMAWAKILCFEDTPNAVRRRVKDIKELFPSSAHLEERRMFSRLHRIVLNLVDIDLETELQRCCDVDVLDADGRTALHWAAGRGDSEAVALLLRYGADPDRPDRMGQGPLRSSLKASDTDCMMVLLKAGANIMQTDDWRQTCLQAAVYYSDPVKFGLPLIEAGINIDAQDISGSYALLEAVRAAKHDALSMLLAHGADPTIHDLQGLTPFLAAAARNDHDAINLLLETPILDTSARDKKSRNILHYAAQYADLAMLKILMAVDLTGLDGQHLRADGLSAIQVAEARWKRIAISSDASESVQVDEAWIECFTGLLENVKTRVLNHGPKWRSVEPVSSKLSAESSSDSIYFDIW